MHCDTRPFPIAELFVERNAIDEKPPYQRESFVWSPPKKELFIDSLLNGYDIPKIYFHDLRGKRGLKKYAIIDGKQRLHTLYEFLADGFPLAIDFKLNDDVGFDNIEKGMYFSGFSDQDKERFKAVSLSVVLVKDAADDDIEDLFFRLNNGEPLNGAEKRNARGGAMNELIRSLAKDKFFTEKLRFDNKRFAHLEIAAKILLLEIFK